MSAVIYEVTLRVAPAIAGEFRDWLHAHVGRMLSLPGFLDARLCEQRDPAPAEGGTVFCCLYRLRDAAALDAYLHDHAPRMRAEGVARFGDRFQASRRVLSVVADY